MPMAHRDFHETSYDLHRSELDAYGADGALKDFAETWLSEDTADAWRHERMYRCLEPLLADADRREWLTVGDGRFGKDAHQLAKRGARAVATDISDELLKLGKERGYITAYSRENAESLSFADGSFDYVLCKEAYHHFPRPPVALYEMLRVARQAVVLIEPHEPGRARALDGAWRPALHAYEVAKGVVRALGAIGRSWRRGEKDRAPDGAQGEAVKRAMAVLRDADRRLFEPSGNYIYRLSEREVEKMAMGVGLPALAFKTLNDFHIRGGECQPASRRSPVFKRMRALIAVQDGLAALGLLSRGLLVAILFKETPADAVRRALAAAGYRVRALPKNPFVVADRGEGRPGHPR